MPETFDPYEQWLGIPPEDHPVDFYRLLGISRFEADVEVIREAIRARTAQVESRREGARSAEANRLLEQMRLAEECLCDPARKAEYDEAVRQQASQKTQSLGETSAQPQGGPSRSDVSLYATTDPDGGDPVENAASPSGEATSAWDQQGHPAEQSAEPAQGAPSAVLQSGGGYRLLDRLGSGSFGNVWKGEAPGGVEVAVKVVNWPPGHKFTQLELRSLELMKRMRHPFLLQIQAYWMVNDQLYIVMDLADGSLDARLNECIEAGQEGIPVEELLIYIRESAEALDYLHEAEIIHRDIKPANILLLKGHARIGDFGLARLLLHDSLELQATTVGTPLFMAPEVWEEQIRPQSDQYSLAATYVLLRHNRPLFSATDVVRVMRDHLESAPDLSHFPAAEQKVLRKALAKKPKDRYPTCSEFAKDLERAVTGEVTPLAAEPDTGRRGLLIGGIALLALPLAGGLAWMGLSQGGKFEVVVPEEISVRAGEKVALYVGFKNAPGSDLALDLQDLPQGVQATLPPAVRPNEDAKVVLHVDVNTPPGEKQLSVAVAAGDQPYHARVRLVIQSPKVTIPPGCAPAADSELVAADGKTYYRRIVRDVGDGMRVSFVLIEHRRSSDPPTFYMLEDMVSNAVFARFAEDASAPLVQPDAWKKGALAGSDWLAAADHPQLPVMNVSVDDAFACARWLGGHLPTIPQWDKAAGLFDAAKDARGPFREPWETGQSKRIGVSRRQEGPLPVGTAPGDVSPFGCRDMAGNGREWTRDFYGKNLQVPFDDHTPFDAVTLRSRSYTASRPLFYADLRDPEETQIESQLYDDASPETGFRVVIEL